MKKRVPKSFFRPKVKSVRIYETVRVYSDGREVCGLNPGGRSEYRRRLWIMCERQSWQCAMCLRSMKHFEIRETRFKENGCLFSGAPTFDHESGRGMGGGHRDDRIEVEGKWHNAAVCLACNTEKGSRRIPYKISQDSPESSPPTRQNDQMADKSV